MLDPDAYDQGYRQALQDVAKLIGTSAIPVIGDTQHKKQFWQALIEVPDCAANRWEIFRGGYRVAVRELRERIENLEQQM